MDRILVDLGADGRVSVSTSSAGGPPQAAGELVELGWPLGSDELEDLRWYLEDYLRAPFAVYEDRGSQIAERLPHWGQALFTALFGSGPAQDAYLAVRHRATEPGQVEVVVRADTPTWLGLPGS